MKNFNSILTGLGTLIIVVGIKLVFAEVPPKTPDGNMLAESTLKWKKTLRGGETVELIGLASYPSEDKQWWDASGSPLRLRPYTLCKPQAPSTWRPRKVDPNDNVYELALILPAKLNAVDMRHFTDPVSMHMYAMPYGQDPSSKTLQAIIIAPWGNPKKLDIRFGVAVGDQWDSHAVVPAAQASGWKSNGLKIIEVIENDGRTSISYSSSLKNCHTRMSAIDQQGNEIRLNRKQSKGGHVFILTYSCPLQAIKEFRFESQPYQYVEFTGVSLAPAFFASTKQQNQY